MTGNESPIGITPSIRNQSSLAKDNTYIDTNTVRRGVMLSSKYIKALGSMYWVPSKCCSHFINTC